MPSSNSAQASTNKAGEERLPVFWCSLLRPLIYGEIPPQEAGRFLHELATVEFTFPDGRRHRPSWKTLSRKWKLYRNGGFEALFRKRRSDIGLPRKASSAIIAGAVMLKTEQPRRSAESVNQLLQSEFGATIPRSTLYHHLKLAGATRAKLADCGQNQDTEKHRWQSDEKWLTKLARGTLSAEALAESSQPLSVEDVDTLLTCVRKSPQFRRKYAIAVLAHHNGIPTPHVMAFLGVSERSINRWVRTCAMRGVKTLLRDRFPGRGPHNKAKDQDYVRPVFEILHAPPSSFGINRTTWRLRDIAAIMMQRGLLISASTIARITEAAGYSYRKAKRVLTSPDPDYREKLKAITRILSNLGPDEKFFSVDEYGPFAVKKRGGRSLTPRGQNKSFPQHQKSKGSLIVTAALELSTNQITHFYSPAKNTPEMIRLLESLVEKYAAQSCIYFSWDAASWHASKALYARVEEINRMVGKPHPQVKLAPLPKSAQFLNVIESVFSGLAKAVVHNSDYESVEACKVALDRHFKERNEYFEKNPKRAGDKIWGRETTKAQFSESNNCKDPDATWS